MNLVAVPAASCGGVSPPARIPGGTPDALAREDACATSAGQFMGRLLANNERSHSTRLLKPGALWIGQTCRPGWNLPARAETCLPLV